MKNSVFIEKVAINDKGIISVKPHDYCFEMIYRCAKGVYWDNSEKHLYFVSPVKQENEILNAYKQILFSVNDEYGILLRVNEKTIYEGVPERIKKDIAEFNDINMF